MDMTLSKSLLRRLGSRVLRALRIGMKAPLQWFDDATRMVAMVGILRPAADFLPLSWALALARGFAFAGVALSGRGRRAMLLMRHAFGDGTNDREIRRLAVQWTGRPGRDSVLLRGILRGRIDPSCWRVEERNADLVEPLRRSGTPFIIATGHFAREASIPLSLPSITPAKMAVVANPPIVKTWHPGTRWLGYHYGQMLNFMQWARPDWEFCFPGTPGLLRTLIQHLRAPGNAIIILADAPWSAKRSDSHVRPFAGRQVRAFATGTAHLSRLSQCPIVVCLPYLAEDSHVVIEWTRIIPPAPPHDAASDARVIDLVLNDLEVAIGKRPSQYVLDFLNERRWDANSERWQCGESPTE